MQQCFEIIRIVIKIRKENNISYNFPQNYPRYMLKVSFDGEFCILSEYECGLENYPQQDKLINSRFPFIGA